MHLLSYFSFAFILVGVKGDCPRDVDPCSSDVYSSLDDPTRSTGYNGTLADADSDFHLAQNWYRSISGAGEDMPTSEVATLQCNAVAPIYLTGSLPSESDGIVDLPACASYNGDTCARDYTIPVKNCSDFNIYCLSSVTDVYDRYCIGSETECPSGYSSESGFTPCEEIVGVVGSCPRNIDPCSSEHYTELDDPSRSIRFNVTDVNEHDYILSELWYRHVSGAGGDMPTEPVFTSQCNAYAPVYLRGDLPAESDGIVNMTGCASYLQDNCVRYYVIPVKNCGDFNVYCLPPVADAYDRYCFGTELECEDGYTSDTGFTPDCEIIVEESEEESEEDSGNKSSAKKKPPVLIIVICVAALLAIALVAVAILAFHFKKKRTILAASSSKAVTYPHTPAMPLNEFSRTRPTSPPPSYNEVTKETTPHYKQNTRGKPKKQIPHDERPASRTSINSVSTPHGLAENPRAITPVL